MAKDKSANIINWIAAAGALYFVGSAIAGAIKRKREAEGVGKVERIKRRIYKEVSLAQQAGVDFSKKFPELTSVEKDALVNLGQEVGWKQSKRAIESGKPYAESYYNSLRRAWNAVSGVESIGRAYNVKDANGNIVLTWIEDAAAHVEAEQRTLTSAPVVKRPTKAEQKASARKAEYQERAQFAEDFLEGLRSQPYRSEYLDQKNPNGETVEAIIIRDFANNKLKAKQDGFSVFIDGEWYNDGGMLYLIVNDLIEAWNDRYISDGFSRGDINDIRRALLDKAQHMQVRVPYDEYDKYKHLADEDGVIRGNNRYEVLDKLNWVTWVHQHYDRGGDTYYPMQAYFSKEDAILYHGGKMKGSGWKILPIWEVPIEKITGVSGIGYAE